MHWNPASTAALLGCVLTLLPAGLRAEDANKGSKPQGTSPRAKKADAEAAETAKNGKNGKATRGGADAAAKSESDSYSVIQIGYDVRVVKSSEVSALREKNESDFKAAVKSFEEAKKVAAKAKKKFTDVKPVKPAFKTIASALKQESDAKARRDKEAVKAEALKKKAKEGAASNGGNGGNK